MTSGFLHLLSPIKISGGTEITSNQIKVGNIIINSSLSSRIAVGDRVVISTTNISLGEDTILTKDQVSTLKVIANEIEATTIKTEKTQINNQIISEDFIIREDSKSVKETIASHTNTLADHTQRISTLEGLTTTMNQNIANQGSTIQTLTQRMNTLNFNGGYGIFGRLNNSDNKKNKLVGHIAAVGPLIYGYLYNSDAIKDLNNDNVIVTAIDGLWTNCNYNGPLNNILLSWTGSDSIRIFRLTRATNGKIKIEFVRERNYLNTVEQNNTFFWYQNTEVGTSVAPENPTPYQSRREYVLYANEWTRRDSLHAYEIYGDREIEATDHQILIPSSTKCICTCDDYPSIESKEVVAEYLDEDVLYVHVYSTNAPKGVADIRFKMKNKPTKDIHVSVLITSEGYR